MTARNDITGDLIKTKVSDDRKFKKGYDGIDWSVKLEDPAPTPDKPAEPTQMELDFGDEEAERRMDIIGQNGPIGYGE
jgi:hypothetical protein